MKTLFSFKRSRIRIAVVCAVAISAVFPASAQSSFEQDYIFWGYPTAYLNYEAKVAYPLIDKMLQTYPPKKKINNNRQLALIALDQFLHDAQYNKRDAFYSFAQGRFSLVPEILKQPVTTGVRVIKLYNSGFILKTRNTAVAVDFVPGVTASQPFITDEAVNAIIDGCDALLITNGDAGYVNSDIAFEFAAKGKKVIVPTGVLTNLGGMVQTVGADDRVSIQLSGLTLHVLPGHNGNDKNNIYIMDFNGNGIVAHTGAQSNEDDWFWIDLLHNQYNTDILLTKSQNINIESMLLGFMPRLVITAHENEMESTVDKRESYWATQKRMKDLARLNIPNVIMTWGETYDYDNTKTADNGYTETDNNFSSARKVLLNGVIYIERKGSIYTTTGTKVK